MFAGFGSAAWWGATASLIALLTLLLVATTPASARAAAGSTPALDVTITRSSPTAVTVRWSDRRHGASARRYAIFVAGRLRARTGLRTTTITGLRCATRYRLSVAIVGRSTGRTRVSVRTRACRHGMTKRAPRGSALAPAAADTTAPVVSITDPANGSSWATATPLIGGLTGGLVGDSALVTVRVFSGSSVSGSLVQSVTTPRLAGNWYLTTPAALAPGTYTVRSEQSDAAGNVGYSAAVVFTVTGVDATAPVVSLVAPPASSSDTTPTLAGVAGVLAGDSSSVTVRVFAGSSVAGAPAQTLTAARGSGGAYSVDAPALTPSTYTARAEQSDAAGNVGYSAAVTFTITGSDTVAPVLTLNAPPASSTDVTPTFAGVGGVAVGDSSLVTVRVFAGSGVAGALVQSLSTARGAGGAYSVDAVSLAPGTYTARAEQSDAGGNVGYSVARTFVVVAGADVTAPLVSITDPANGSSSSDAAPLIGGLTGGLDGDGASVTIRIYTGSSVSGALLQSFTTPRLSGNWYLTRPAALAPGTYTVRSEQSDAAGNVGYSAAVVFTVTGVDATAPVVSLTAPPSSSTNTTPALGGYGGQASGDSATVTIRIHSGTSVSGSIVQTLTATVGFGGAYSVDASPLANATYTARAAQTDAAGNTGYSSPVTFTIGTGGGGGTPGVSPSMPTRLPASTGAIFYVATTGADSNAGSSAAPWRTVQKALNTLTAGQIAIVRAGTYVESLDMSRAGTPSAPITVRAEAGARPILRAGTGQPDNTALHFRSGAAYIRVQGFTIEGATGPSSTNVYADGSSHDLEISECEIRGSQRQGFFSEASTSRVHVIACRIHDNGGSGPSNLDHNLYVQGSSHLIASNLITGAPNGYGIQLYQSSDHVVITGNTIAGNALDGIVVGSSSAGTTTDALIVNNVLTGNRAAISTYWGGAVGANDVARNNLSWGNSTGDFIGTVITYSANLFANPLFVNAGAGDYHLQATSPALGVADPAYSTMPDLDGVVRPVGSGADLGAYER